MSGSESREEQATVNVPGIALRAQPGLPLATALGLRRCDSSSEKRERLAHQSARGIAQLAYDAEVVPVRNQEWSPMHGRMALRPTLPQQPRLTDELARLARARCDQHGRRHARPEMDRTHEIRQARVQTQVDVHGSPNQRVES